MEQATEMASEEGVLSRLGDALLPAPAEEPAPQEAVQQDEQPEVQEQETEEVEEAPEDDGLVELELEGDVVRVPPKIKEGYLRREDYTKKTQELAHHQKGVVAAYVQQELTAKFQAETRAEQEELASIKSSLAQYKAYDLSNITTEQYIRVRGEIDRLKDREGELQGSLNQKASSVQQQIAKARADASKNAYEYIGRHIKDWSPNSDTEKSVANYAQDYGITPDALAEVSIRFPGFAVMAAKASKYDSLQKNKMEAVRSVKAPPVVKPGAVTSTQTQQTQQYKKTRERLKKSGDINDAAALILQRMR